MSSLMRDRILAQMHFVCSGQLLAKNMRMTFLLSVMHIRGFTRTRLLCRSAELISEEEVVF